MWISGRKKPPVNEKTGDNTIVEGPPQLGSGGRGKRMKHSDEDQRKRREGSGWRGGAMDRTQWL
jgi:hypothetical protein